ncbi:SdpI family protein [Flavobacterium silvisoli]|uniref:SdpI family protein n=1 Tax=Flavobacterium silvisoli TaxID=2529433 RepID=A0A4Q9Z442_9FLAO|nr:SdpI family protein [Flavobacterium silvisoli]TBX71214.1 SdpI family protein [Flavobacterium silvisoli]
METLLNYLNQRIGITTFLIGVVLTITAILTKLFPPKKINYLYGYRTAASMKNQQTWDFAQKYSTKIMVSLGLGLIAFSFLDAVMDISEVTSTGLGIGLMILGFIYMMITTEKAIKKNFPNE